jgi:hypothetical protein
MLVDFYSPPIDLFFITQPFEQCAIADFVVLVESLGITIESRVVVDAVGRKVKFTGRGFTANLFGEQGVFLLSRKAS